MAKTRRIYSTINVITNRGQGKKFRRDLKTFLNEKGLDKILFGDEFRNPRIGIVISDLTGKSSYSLPTISLNFYSKEPKKSSFTSEEIKERMEELNLLGQSTRDYINDLPYVAACSEIGEGSQHDYLQTRRRELLKKRQGPSGVADITQI